MPDDIHRPPGDGRTSSQGAAVLAASDHLPMTARWLARRFVDTPNATHMAPVPSGSAVASPSGAPVQTRAGGASTSGSEPGGRGQMTPAAATPSDKDETPGPGRPSASDTPCTEGA